MRKFYFAATLAAVILAGCNAANCHEGKSEAGEENEVKVPIAEVPETVRATFADVSHGAKVNSLDKEDDNGKTAYEGDAVIDGQNYEVKIDPSGKLISKTVDNEEAEGGEKEKTEKGEKKGEHEDKD